MVSSRKEIQQPHASRSAAFCNGFRVLGNCRQPRRLVDAYMALAAYAGCDARAELHRESYLSAFRFGAELRDHLAKTGSTAGFVGPCWTDFVWWDIDREGDLPAALEDARRLCVYLGDKLDVRDDDLLTFYSGSKGFHVGIPSGLWTPTPGRAFHRITRRFAESVAEHAGASIDPGVYDRVRCWRAPNSQHPKTGLHKRWLVVSELMHLHIDAILKLAEQPEPFELPVPTYRSEAAVQLWAEAGEHVRRQAESHSERLANGDTTSRLNRTTLDFVRDGAAQGDRHRLCYSSAANMAELGAPLRLCVALLEESALDSGLSPADVLRAIENGWASVQPGVRNVCVVVGGEVVAMRQATPEDSAEGGAA